MIEVTGRIVKRGNVCAKALVSSMPISFLGGIDPETGNVIAKDSDIFGASISGRILVFPTGKGSTVGSYVMLSLAKNGVGPKAIINASSEPIVCVGAIISDIPMVDKIDISLIETGNEVCIDNEKVTIYKP